MHANCCELNELVRCTLTSQKYEKPNNIFGIKTLSPNKNTESLLKNTQKHFYTPGHYSALPIEQAKVKSQTGIFISLKKAYRVFPQIGQTEITSSLPFFPFLLYIFFHQHILESCFGKYKPGLWQIVQLNFFPVSCRTMLLNKSYFK